MKIQKVLIVDNNITIVELVGSLLEQSGFEVMKAYGGMEAFELLENTDDLPDTIILDLVMPKIDGNRLTKILKRDDRYASIPVIILSGIASEADDDILTCGADAFIAKGRIEETFSHIHKTLLKFEETEPPYEKSGKILGAEKLYPREMTRELLLVKRHFDSMISLMAEGVIEIDQLNRILYTNPAACRVLGEDDTVLFGKPFRELFHSDENLDLYLKKLPASPADKPESIQLDRNGKTLKATATPFDMEGDYLGAIIIFQDITSIVHREQALEELMTAIVENAPVGLCLTDEEGQVLVSNPVFGKILGQAAQWSPTGINLPSFLAERNLSLAETVKEGLKLEPRMDLNSTISLSSRGDEERQVVQVDISALEVSEGRRFLLLLEDITHKAVLEDNLRRVNEEMAKANKAKSSFLSMVSHELRTPLSVVRGYISLILEGKIGPDKEQVTDALKVADKRARHLQHLIEELLDLSRIESGKLSINKESLSAKKHLLEVLEMFREDQDRKKLTIEIDLPDGLPPVSADHDKLHQIFTNLLSNAIKFSEENGLITVRGRTSGTSVEFRVTDSGIGIPGDKIDSIFEKFYQVDSSDTRRHAGTGLGLSIVKIILNALGGTINVTSEVGGGSTFIFTLPAGEPEGEPASPTPSVHAPPSTAPPEAGLRRILVVEDDKDTMALIRMLLPESEFEVTEATDAFKGIREFYLQRPDLVLADALLPVMSGLELCRIIKSHPEAAATPVIMLSAAAQENEIRQGYEVGADEYLVKPFASEDLLENIRKLTGGAGTK